MQRYDMLRGTAQYPNALGEWVRYEDAQQRIAELEAALKVWCDEECTCEWGEVPDCENCATGQALRKARGEQ